METTQLLLRLTLICWLAGCSGEKGSSPPEDQAFDLFDTLTEVAPAPDDGHGIDCPPDQRDTLDAELLTDLPAPPDVSPDTPPDLPTCNCAPPTVAVTVNEIPATMNGSQAYLGNDLLEHPFQLALPTWGFVWNVTVDCPCGCDDDAMEALLATDEDMPVFGLEEHFAVDGDGGWRWDVSEELSLPAQPAGLCARATDACGNSTEWSCLQVKLVEPTPALHPFQPPDPWLLVWRRDHRAIGLVEDGDGVLVWSDDGANGTWDFIEDLWLLGLGTSDPTPEWAALDCGWAQGGNECAVRAILEAIRPEAYKFYFKEVDGTCGDYCADILFMIEGEEGAPAPAAFQYETLSGDEESRKFSKIGFGGGDLSLPWVGLSESVDPRNDGNEDNAKAGYGCLTTSLFETIISQILADPDLQDLAAIALGGVTPFLGGTAFGEHPEDHLVIDPAVPDNELSAVALQRRKTWDFVVDVLGFGLAALTVHEIGHAVGMVAYGAPPNGLFGSETKAVFVDNPAGCDGAHLDTDGLNLMQAGPGSGNGFQFSMDMLSEPVGFNELNAAYLKGQILVLP